MGKRTKRMHMKTVKQWAILSPSPPVNGSWLAEIRSSAHQAKYVHVDIFYSHSSLTTQTTRTNTDTTVNVQNCPLAQWTLSLRATPFWCLHRTTTTWVGQTAASALQCKVCVAHHWTSEVPLHSHLWAVWAVGTVQRPVRSSNETLSSTALTCSHPFLRTANLSIHGLITRLPLLLVSSSLDFLQTKAKCLQNRYQFLYFPFVLANVPLVLLKELNSILPMVEPKIKSPPPEDAFRITWLGHATLLVEFDNIAVLTDPIFSERASPSQVIGPKRYREPPCTVRFRCKLCHFNWNVHSSDSWFTVQLGCCGHITLALWSSRLEHSGHVECPIRQWNSLVCSSRTWWVYNWSTKFH